MPPSLAKARGLKGLTVPGLEPSGDQLLVLAGTIQRMAEEKDLLCKRCNHPSSAHTRDVYETRATRVDEALVGAKPEDIYSGRPRGESGCTVPGCSCRQYYQ